MKRRERGGADPGTGVDENLICPIFRRGNRRAPDRRHIRQEQREDETERHSGWGLFHQAIFSLD